MKKIFLFLIFFMLFFCPFSYADRETATITTYKASQLIKTGEGRIYSVSFVAASNNGNFILYDALSATGGHADVKSEGSEATSGNSQFLDYSKKPLEFKTGLYLSVTNGYVILSYE